jgi:tetratricopeptide (TPR) repeat protein
MTADSKHDDDDKLLSDLLRALEADAAPVDVEFLARLRDQSAAEFSRAAHESVSNRTHAALASDSVTISSGKDSTMFTLAARLAFSITAACIGGVVWLAAWTGSGEAVGAVSLSQILFEAEGAETLELKVVRDGTESSVWIRQKDNEPKRLRWEDMPSLYQIAEGSRLWRIDENENRVQTGSTPWFVHDKLRHSFDLLSMLGVSDSFERVGGLRSAGRVRHAERDCHVFRFKATQDDRRVRVECFADAETNELLTIAAWPVDMASDDGPPIAELRLIARNKPVDEAKFVVAKSLSNDGRIGRVVDAQGIVMLRPVMHSRWTPISRQMLIRPGDWLRTDVRGANAAAVAMTSQFKVVAGPGSLVEIQSPRQILLHGGEVQITGSDHAEEELTLLAPNDQKVVLKAGETGLFRLLANRRLKKIEKKPVWLAGFEGSSNEESIGSLIAIIDGRNVPLTVGYHKVSVEIRDQIARTTIEESFVNRTRSRLEGVFHFPLPQDASISGFGMWIGNELVEADVVEKQRAREIYETILRERRDPGLLEWAGGNIFKARVFPIEALSEKRIKIVYTQVLPLRANQYRYSYALRSELLQKTPLRELSLDVLINSELPLRSVKCPTHSVRSDMTEHSAHIEFAAQEYSPTRDFEVVCQVDEEQSEVVVIPHQRGDDGYFLAQITLPEVGGNWQRTRRPDGDGNWRRTLLPYGDGNGQREVLPDGDPLDVMLVCDTSASMDSDSRKKQGELVAAMLSSLGPKDRFNVAVCDVDCHWLFPESVPAGEDNEKAIRKARQWLRDRTSLGWTDLDKAFASIQDQASTDSHVIYIGDGIVTSGDADPQAFASRVDELFRDKSNDGVLLAGRGLDPPPKPTFHAISVSSSFESVVLKSIAGIGGGSVRAIGGERAPQTVAFELLNEIAQPMLTDLTLEFRGLQIAAVYPKRLPNLAAGTQLIIVGRYLPRGEGQSGEMVIEGRRGRSKLKIAARVQLKDGEAGNSFIPRLWARAHMDQLLQQGTSQFIKDEIIGLSEEFHIITPYTSLLVLESDADRERFGVTRRFEMRDGQRFFAEGKDNAKYELLQQQMKRAGDWRLGLRRSILSKLARLGRSTVEMQQFRQMVEQRPGSGPMDEISKAISGTAMMPMSGGYGGGYMPMFSGTTRSAGSGSRSNGFYNGLGGGGSSDRNGNNQYEFRTENVSVDLNGPLSDFEMAMSGEDSGREFSLESDDELLADIDGFSKFGMKKLDEVMEFQPARLSGAFELTKLEARKAKFGRGKASFGNRSQLNLMSSNLSQMASAEAQKWGGRSTGYNAGAQYVNWVNQLLPNLPAVSAGKAPVVEPAWSPEAIAVSESLLQKDALAALKTAVEVRSKSEVFDPRWNNRKTTERRTLELIAKDRWLRSTSSAPAQSIMHWCDGLQRGVLGKAFLLGRVKASTPEDRKTVSQAAAPYSQASLRDAFRNYDADVQTQGDRTILLLSLRGRSRSQVRVTIDSERNVVLSVEHLERESVTSRTIYGPYEKIAGLWWAARKEMFDDQGRRKAVDDYSVKELEVEPFAKRFDEELSLRDRTQFITGSLPSVRKAEVAVADGSAGFEDRLVLLLRSSLIQKWDDVLTQLEHLEKLSPDKSGLQWIRTSVMKAARRNEDVRQLLLARCEELVEERPDEYFLAKFMIGEANGIVSPSERLELLDKLRPVFERQPEYVLGLRDWQILRIGMLRSLGRNDEFLALQKVVAENAPWDENAQGQYARDLAGTGDYDAAYQWLRKELDRDAERHEYEIDQLRRAYSALLTTQSRADALVEFLKEWADTGSENQQLYAEYLSALGLANRDNEADVLVGKWLAAGRIEGEISGPELARFSAALSFTLGQRHNRSISYILPEWLKPLAETGRFFLRHEHHFSFAKRILDSYYFKQNDEFDELIVEVAEILSADASTLPLDVVASMVGWCLASSKLTTSDWDEISQTLTVRWQQLEKTDQQRALGRSIVQIFKAKFPQEKLLPFMRQRITRADDANEPKIAASFSLELFNELLTREWTEENEIETFGLLERVSSADSVIARVTVQVESMHRLVDVMLRGRFQSSLKELHDEGHPEELTRTELSAKQIEFRKSARTGLAERLIDEVAKRTLADGDAADETSAMLRDWLNIERMYLDVVLGRNLEEVAAECWKALGDSPPASLTGDELESLDADDVKRLILPDMLRSRTLATLTNLAVRRSAPKGLADRVLKYIDEAIQQEQAAASEDDDEGFGWKSRKFDLLVALDRSDDLERDLRKWIGTDDYVVPWQLSLGRLLAERGRIDEAIPLFETVEKKSPLSPADYVTLADWYLVADRRSDFERAKVESFQIMQEHQINSWIQQRLYPWQRSDTELPSELDERVLFAFKALFKKSQNPESYVSQVRYFYQLCRDFRLLQVIPDIVIGRTSQQVYAVLKSLQLNLLVELRDEASADEIVARIKTLQEQAESAIDRRALDLLESMVERKSTELLNQPGPHVDAAVGALKRAFEREWGDGEPRQMADFLQALGKITQPKLADEQMRQLTELHRRAEPGTDDRLFIAYSIASGHFNSYGRRDEGIAVMENAIREFEQTHTDGWPLDASTPLSGYVSFLEGVSRFAQAEVLLDGHLKNPLNPQTSNWLLKRQNQVLHAALKGGGRVSLGEGATLYKKLLQRMTRQAQEMDVSYQYAMLSDLIGVFRTAKNKHLPTVSEDLRKFSSEQLPQLLGTQTHQYRNLVNQFARALRDISGPRYGLEFLMDRVEDWPRRMRNTYEDAWSQCGHNMGWWWQETAGNARDLEPRLLKIVLAALRFDLTTRQRRSGYFFRKHHNYYWSAKEGEFARVAEEVLKERAESPRTVNHVSEYLWRGLEHRRRAIGIRLIAHKKKLLADEDLYVLTTWLHHERRWAEAIPIMEPLVQRSPDTMKYRTALLTSYTRSSRPEQRDELLAQIDEHFRGGGRWTEANIALLAATCVEVQLDETAVKYYGELIPLAQRTRPNRGIGEGTVSSYYQRLSQSHTRLGNTKEAVDAASGAIVAWGPRHDQRTSAVNQMKSAIRLAKRLDEYVEFLDDQLEESGQDSPLIRRIVGVVYAEKGQHQAAVAQLQLAAELQPFDSETHVALIRSYDALKDGKSAMAQILKQLDFDRHNLDLYKDLAKRLKNNEGQSERAVTTLVEAAPKEAEHHEALAVIRQEQNRWGEAIDHWKHVAALRALEPTGLLKLAEAQIHEKRWPAAWSTIGKLKAKAWPSRFSNVEGQTRQLENRIKP